MATYEVIVETPVVSLIEIDYDTGLVEVARDLLELTIDFTPAYLIEVLDPATASLIEIGVTGPQGPPGIQGPAGPTGPGGAGMHISNIPPTPSDGILWYNTDTDLVFVSKDGQWDQFVMHPEVPFLTINAGLFI